MIRCTLSGRRADGSSCDTCRLALRNGRADPNWRNNVGVLLRFRRADGTCGLVQVDVTLISTSEPSMHTGSRKDSQPRMITLHIRLCRSTLH